MFIESSLSLGSVADVDDVFIEELSSPFCGKNRDGLHCISIDPGRRFVSLINHKAAATLNSL